MKYITIQKSLGKSKVIIFIDKIVSLTEQNKRTFITTTSDAGNVITSLTIDEVLHLILEANNN